MSRLARARRAAGDRGPRRDAGVDVTPESIAEATTPVADVPAAFTRTVIEAFAARPGERFTLMLSGGPTAKLCYEHLCATGGAVGDERG